MRSPWHVSPCLPSLYVASRVLISSQNHAKQRSKRVLRFALWSPAGLAWCCGRWRVPDARFCSQPRWRTLLLRRSLGSRQCLGSARQAERFRESGGIAGRGVAPWICFSPQKVDGSWDGDWGAGSGGVCNAFLLPTAPHCARGLWGVCALDATAEAMHTAGHSSSGRRHQPGRPQRENPWVCNNSRPWRPDFASPEPSSVH